MARVGDSTRFMRDFLNSHDGRMGPAADAAGDYLFLLVDEPYSGRRRGKAYLRTAFRHLQSNPTIRNESSSGKQAINDDSVMLSRSEIQSAERFFKQPQPDWSKSPLDLARAIPVEPRIAWHIYLSERFYNSEWQIPKAFHRARISIIACAVPYFFRDNSLALMLWTRIAPEDGYATLDLYRLEAGVWRYFSPVYNTEGGSDYFDLSH